MKETNLTGMSNSRVSCWVASPMATLPPKCSEDCLHRSMVESGCTSSHAEALSSSGCWCLWLPTRTSFYWWFSGHSRVHSRVLKHLPFSLWPQSGCRSQSVPGPSPSFAQGHNLAQLLHWQRGLISYHIGWQYIFYIFASFGILWSGLVIFFVYESPLSHPRISQVKYL